VWRWIKWLAFSNAKDSWARMTSTSWDFVTPTHRCQRSGLAEVWAGLEKEDAKSDSKMGCGFSWALKDPDSRGSPENQERRDVSGSLFHCAKHTIIGFVGSAGFVVVIRVRFLFHVDVFAELMSICQRAWLVGVLIFCGKRWYWRHVLA
jgi:hypothetical protein